MSLQSLAVHDDGTPQTVRGLRTLMLLGAACALFVGVVALVVAPAAEPPIAAQVVESEPAAVEPSLGA